MVAILEISPGSRRPRQSTGTRGTFYLFWYNSLCFKKIDRCQSRCRSVPVLAPAQKHCFSSHDKGSSVPMPTLLTSPGRSRRPFRRAAAATTTTCHTSPSRSSSTASSRNSTSAIATWPANSPQTRRARPSIQAPSGSGSTTRTATHTRSRSASSPRRAGPRPQARC